MKCVSKTSFAIVVNILVIVYTPLPVLDDDKNLPNITPIFITLDPDRDTPAHLASYIKGI